MPRRGQRIPLNFDGQDGGAEAERELRADATTRIAALLDHPPALLLTPSCSTALQLAAIATGVGPGDEVVVPAFTHPSTANAFLLGGATVRLADIRPDTLNVDVDSVHARLTDRTRCVVVTHYAGISGITEGLTLLANSMGLTLVEDAAHGLFARQDGVPLGRVGALGCISFHRTKNVSSISGGAIVVNRPELVDPTDIAARKGTNLTQFHAGLTSRYEWSGPGLDGLMATPSLRELVRQLDQAEAIQQRRHEIWRRYSTELRSWALAHDVQLPSIPQGADHPAHIFHLVAPTGVARNAVIEQCSASGIEAARHYVALSDSTFALRAMPVVDPCPVASDIAERLVRLPLHHGLMDDDVDRIIEAVTAAVW